MQQVTDWLEKLGVSEYAQRFADNDIDFAILGDLTDQDLKDLGVGSLGHRRKILRAIAELDRPESGAPCRCACPIVRTGATFAFPNAGSRDATDDPGAPRSRRRTPLSHGDVLRSSGLDCDFRPARCRGMAAGGIERRLLVIVSPHRCKRLHATAC